MLTAATEHRRAARILAAALEQSEFAVTTRSDAAGSPAAGTALALGGRGFPVLVLDSGAPGTTGTAADVAASTDGGKIARVGRALALAATAVTRGE
jgi:hypothetical protein